jgi:hypothetical protein
VYGALDGGLAASHATFRRRQNAHDIRATQNIASEFFPIAKTRVE